MAGLGSVEENSNGVYLSIAGGYIWDRKQSAKLEDGSKNPNYATQEFIRADKTTGVRAGARYANFAGKVVNVYFKTHNEYGESVNIVLDAGEDRFILSIGTNNRYSQDIMKFLLKADLNEEVFIKPYDFIDKDKRRAQGVTFKQDGQKIALRNDDAPFKEKDWWKQASKKQVKRFFEDLTDWFVAEVEEKVCSQFSDDLPKIEKQETGLGKVTKETESVKEEVKEDTKTETIKTSEPVAVTPMKMRRAVKAYIVENYEGKELPKLEASELKVWYNLVLNDEELPFKSEDTEEKSEVSGEDLDSELQKLIG